MLRPCDQRIDGEMFFPLAYADFCQKHLSYNEHSSDSFTVAAVVPRTGECVLTTTTRPAPGRCRTLVVGRHESSGLTLKTDSTLSLRHAVIILSSDRHGNPFVRVIDLRSVFGLQDWAHNKHTTLTANGPVALRLAETALFIFPPGGALNGQVSYDDLSWATLVPYVPALEPEAQLTAHAAPSGHTTAISIVAARSGLDGCFHGEVKGVVGALELRSCGRIRRQTVDRHQLRKGLLIGRYPRCDINTESVPMAKDISRVHGLFISIDHHLHLVDLGSQNGIRQGKTAAAVHIVNNEARFTFGDSLGMRWLPRGG